MFTESIARRSFPSLEFTQLQIKGSMTEIPETPNDVILEKSWWLYYNLCQVGYELTNAKTKVFFPNARSPVI